MGFSGRSIVLAVLLFGLVGVLAACVKKVELTAGAQGVLFVGNPAGIKSQLDDSERCKLVTTLRITAQGSPGLMEARKKEEAKDRLIRARNAAARNGANLLVEEGALQERTQSYKAYKCG